MIDSAITDANPRAGARTYRPDYRARLGDSLTELSRRHDLWHSADAAAAGATIAAAARQWVDQLPPSAFSFGPDASVAPAALPLANGWVQFEFYGPARRLLELEFGDAEWFHYLKWDPAANVAEEGDIRRADAETVERLIEWSKGD